MSNETKYNEGFYKDYQKRLLNLILEKSNNEISKKMCIRLAKLGTNRMKYDISKGINKSIEEYANMYIEAYLQ